MPKGNPQTSVDDPWAKKTLPAMQRILDKRGVSNGDVARGTKISRTHVCRIFSGNRTPSVRYSKRISGYLGITIEQLWQALDLNTRDVA